MANAKTSVFTFVIYYLLVYCKNVHCGLYLGKFLGKLSELHHGVSGEVYAVDRRTLHIKDFTYDGQGPAAYFWAGNTRAVGPQGFRIRDENGRPEVLRRYRKEGVTLTLPEGKTLNSIKWFSVWCEEFEVNFGDVKIPRNFEYPRPQKIDPLRGVHGISSENIVVVDAQTLLIPSLSYDGEAPDAKFWAGRGSKPSPQGIRIPDENGKELPLRRYDHKTIVLTLPRDMTVFDIGHFGIWCEAFTVDFGHVQLPQNLNIPPSLKMLGISPQKRPRAFDITSEQVPRSQSTLVGGHLEATTYRPPSFFTQQAPIQHVVLQRRIDNTGTTSQHIGNLDRAQTVLVPIQQILQDTTLPYSNQLGHQTQSRFLQEQQPKLQLPIQQINTISQNTFFQQLRPVPYAPINSILPKHLQDNIIYNQLLQNKRFQQEQTKAELSRTHNRFDFATSNHQRFT